MDSEHHYWTYWVHRIQELWRSHETLEKRVAELEKLVAGQSGVKLQTPSPATAGADQPTESGAPPEPSGEPLKEMELTACMGLRELGGDASIHEINAQLAKSRSIKEDAKTTLMRLRGAVQKGYIAMDPEPKRFKLLRDTFVVG